MRRARTVAATALTLFAALLPTPGQAATPPHGPTGWATAGSGTTGGAGAAADSVWTVTTRAELKTALGNHGDPTAPKIIRIRGDISGHEADDGTIRTAENYAPGFDLGAYMSCFGESGTTWSDTRFDYCKQQRILRQTGSNAEKLQIQLTVPSNTTVLGVGDDARLLGVDLTVNAGTNIVVRNLTLEAPVDYFTTWSPDDGAEGNWNARFDAMSVVTGVNLWVDHCTFTDGRHLDSKAPTGFHGKPVQRHDGLLDIEDAADYITVSDSQFRDHDKTLLIGSGDSRGDRDRGHLRITFARNLFANTAERSPRVRFGQVHTYNNYFTASTTDRESPVLSEKLGGAGYFLGLGLESAIVSENNAYSYTGPGASPDVIVADFKGNRFSDRGSWFNGRPVDTESVARTKYETTRAAAVTEAESTGTPVPDWATQDFTTDPGWSPSAAYAYHPLRSAAAVKSYVLRHSGAGRV
ncbi:pectate lyase family protein [Streptomyces sp. NBC_01465]|uniref:pectate lyase family protein n=1 Tax=Streptomyces sp. NBC_01465 TaxID=2903878 RepID=UPI002E3281CB|nr:pectate lyase [Streptomyces sp. NBC_01465]